MGGPYIRPSFKRWLSKLDCFNPKLTPSNRALTYELCMLAPLMNPRKLISTHKSVRRTSWIWMRELICQELIIKAHTCQHPKTQLRTYCLSNNELGSIVSISNIKHLQLCRFIIHNNYCDWHDLDLGMMADETK